MLKLIAVAHILQRQKNRTWDDLTDSSEDKGEERPDCAGEDPDKHNGKGKSGVCFLGFESDCK